MFHRLLPVLLACTTSLSAAQSIYSWKDANGQVHYSDMPPADAKTRTIRQAPLAPAATQNGGRPVITESFAEKEQAFRRRRAEAAEAEDKARKDKAEDERKQKECADLRRYLAGVTGGQRMGRYNDAGEVIMMDDDERAAEAEHTRATLERNCK
ncbi:DUF4124 domain-containing protein [Zoogloea sp.]|uniref:DUF4124 domain-containing protein n=1 Tax=Zoogloea sp. TaxID=49181 RepID=UPI0035B27AAA